MARIAGDFERAQENGHRRFEPQRYLIGGNRGWDPRLGHRPLHEGNRLGGPDDDRHLRPGTSLPQVGVLNLLSNVRRACRFAVEAANDDLSLA